MRVQLQLMTDCESVTDTDSLAGLHYHVVTQRAVFESTNHDAKCSCYVDNAFKFIQCNLAVNYVGNGRRLFYQDTCLLNPRLRDYKGPGSWDCIPYECVVCTMSSFQLTRY